MPDSYFGHYRVEQKLGAGGMGTVYLATDTRLGRQVAIKVLTESFSKDSERLMRFEREARLLASVNHPNIAAIYGLEEHDGRKFLVLEYVPGKTLSEWIGSGFVAVDKALTTADQIAAALEGAHEKGIVHRDLKPENVKITPEGVVKVLDFGIAKAFAGPDTSDSSGEAATRATQQMTILGTGPYMSPEQARGEPVNKRTDIWSFGCVLYEMLAGQPAFHGKSLFETMGAVLNLEPDWDALPVTTPNAIRVLLRRCLRKEAANRLRDIGDARLELEDAVAELKQGIAKPVTSGGGAAAAPARVKAERAPSPQPAVPLSTGFRHSRWGLITGLAAILIIVVGLSVLSRRKPSAVVTTESATAPATFTGHKDEIHAAVLSRDVKTIASGSGDKTIKIWEVASGRGLRTLVGHTGKVTALAYSPDGRWLASASEDRSIRLWDGAQIAGPTLLGHTGAVSTISFSPDGRWLSSGGQDMSVRIWDVQAGRPVRTLTGHTDWIRTSSFSPDGKLLGTAGDDSLLKVWDLATGAEVRSLKHPRGVASAAFSPDGQVLASGTWKIIRLWSTADWSERATLTGHNGWVSSLSFTGDAKTLASGSGDLTAKLWDLGSGKEIRSLAGHTRGISAVAVSPDGKLLVSGSWDTSLRIWDPASGVEVRTLAGVAQ